jgi:hypothetical protein
MVNGLHCLDLLLKRFCSKDLKTENPMKRLHLALLFFLLPLSIHSQDDGWVTVTAQKANLRGTAALNGSVVSSVIRGQKFPVITKRQEWVLVQTPEYVGWLHNTVISETSGVQEVTFEQLLQGLNKPTEKQSNSQISRNSALKYEPVEPANPNRLANGASPFGAGYRSGRSSLTVQNGTDTDALVRVIRLGSYEQLVRNFYVPANESFTASELPTGTYVMRVAFGSDWNEAEKSFNFRKSFTQTDTFEANETEHSEPVYGGVRTTLRASRLSITLHKVRDGNFSSKQISEEDFWRINN